MLYNSPLGHSTQTEEGHWIRTTEKISKFVLLHRHTKGRRKLDQPKSTYRNTKEELIYTDISKSKNHRQKIGGTAERDLCAAEEIRNGEVE